MCIRVSQNQILFYFDELVASIVFVVFGNRPMALIGRSHPPLRPPAPSLPVSRAPSSHQQPTTLTYATPPRSTAAAPPPLPSSGTLLSGAFGLFLSRWSTFAEARERQATIDAGAKIHYDAHAHPLGPLPIGQSVRV